MKKLYTAEGDEILCDDNDFDWLSKWKFRTTKKGNKRPLYGSVGPHHLLLGLAPDGMVIDHIDRNPFNNQRSNLRIISRAHNNLNKGKYNRKATSKFKGVSYSRKENRWLANINKGNKRHIVYRGFSEVEAAIAYNKKALELHGKYAVLNEIPSSLTKRALDGGNGAPKFEGFE